MAVGMLHACMDVCMHVPPSSIFAAMYVAGLSLCNMMQRNTMPCNFNQYMYNNIHTYTCIMYVCNEMYV